MVKRLNKFGGFKARAGRAQNGIAVIFDLEGFSKFFNQPDVHEYIPIYLNKVIDAVEASLFGGSHYWLGESEVTPPLSILPVHRKFLGDGMLYVWTFEDIDDATIADFMWLLCNRLWNIKNNFSKINASCADGVPVMELPPRIRFGVGRGTIYELSVQSNLSKEYIGFCINLASRLQGYCDGLGFIASARLAIERSHIDKNGYIKTVATKIKGFPREIVIVDKAEYARLPDQIRKDLFMDISARQ